MYSFLDSQMNIDQIIKYLQDGPPKSVYKGIYVNSPTISNMIRGLQKYRKQYNEMEKKLNKGQKLGTETKSSEILRIYESILIAMRKSEQIKTMATVSQQLKDVLNFYQKSSNIINRYKYEGNQTFWEKALKLIQYFHRKNEDKNKIDTDQQYKKQIRRLNSKIQQLEKSLKEQKSSKCKMDEAKIRAINQLQKLVAINQDKEMKNYKIKEEQFVEINLFPKGSLEVMKCEYQKWQKVFESLAKMYYINPHKKYFSEIGNSVDITLADKCVWLTGELQDMINRKSKQIRQQISENISEYKNENLQILFNIFKEWKEHLVNFVSGEQKKKHLNVTLKGYRQLLKKQYDASEREQQKIPGHIIKRMIETAIEKENLVKQFVQQKRQLKKELYNTKQDLNQRIIELQQVKKQKQKDASNATTKNLQKDTKHLECINEQQQKRHDNKYKQQQLKYKQEINELIRRRIQKDHFQKQQEVKKIQMSIQKLNNEKNKLVKTAQSQSRSNLQKNSPQQIKNSSKNYFGNNQQRLNNQKLECNALQQPVKEQAKMLQSQNVECKQQKQRIIEKLSSEDQIAEDFTNNNKQTTESSANSKNKVSQQKQTKLDINQSYKQQERFTKQKQAVKLQTQEEIKKLESQIAEIRKQKQQIMKELQETKKEKKTIVKELEELKDSKSKEANEEYEKQNIAKINLISEVQKLKQQLGSLEKQVKDQTKLKDSCSKQLKTLKSQIESRTKQIIQFKEDFAKLKQMRYKQKQDLQSQIAELNKQKQQIINQLQKTKKERESIDKELEELKDSKSKEANEYEKQKQEKENLISEVQKLKQQLGSLEKQVKDQRKLKDSCSKQLKTLKSQIESRKKYITQIKEEITKLKQMRDKQKQESSKQQRIIPKSDILQSSYEKSEKVEIYRAKSPDVTMKKKGQGTHIRDDIKQLLESKKRVEVEYNKILTSLTSLKASEKKKAEEVEVLEKKAKQLAEENEVAIKIISELEDTKKQIAQLEQIKKSLENSIQFLQGKVKDNRAQLAESDKKIEENKSTLNLQANERRILEELKNQKSEKQKELDSLAQQIKKVKSQKEQIISNTDNEKNKFVKTDSQKRSGSVQKTLQSNFSDKQLINELKEKAQRYFKTMQQLNQQNELLKKDRNQIKQEKKKYQIQYQLKENQAKILRSKCEELIKQLSESQNRETKNREKPQNTLILVQTDNVDIIEQFQRKDEEKIEQLKKQLYQSKLKVQNLNKINDELSEKYTLLLEKQELSQRKCTKFVKLLNQINDLSKVQSNSEIECFQNPLTDFFAGQAISNKASVLYLKNQLQSILRRNIIQTRLLYSYPNMKNTKLDNLLLGRQNCVIICKSKKQKVFAMFSQCPLLQRRAQKYTKGGEQRAIIWSISNKKVFLLKQGIQYENSAWYTSHSINFGNEDLKIKVNSNIMYSKIGQGLNLFDFKDQSIKVLTGDSNQITQLECYEIHQITFDQSKF